MSTHPAVSSLVNGNAPLQLAFEAMADSTAIPSQMKSYPDFRYMGSKSRLVPWIHGVLNKIDFETAADPFSGSGCIPYLLKTMGKKVAASDFLNFSATIARAAVENDRVVIEGATLKQILKPARNGPKFIEKTFTGIFFELEDLRFLDRVAFNIENLSDPYLQALAQAALIRSCLKKQPRGVFTVGGNRYDDGRRDLRLTIEQHFLEQVEKFNEVVFDNGHRHSAIQQDAFDSDSKGIDLVYLDPPYVPRSDDNCYVKRYHFLEGLSCYWRGLDIMSETKVKKITKKFTPFSYRRTAVDAFERLFHTFRDSTVVLSYSSNGFPDLCVLEDLLKRYKRKVEVYQKPHRYHFGTHKGVERAVVNEYLLVGSR